MSRSIVSRCALVLGIAATACTGSENAPKVPLAQAPAADTARSLDLAPAVIGPAARAKLDSGNILYRHKAYAAALVQYRAASALAPGHAAPFFGIYMVARAINDTAMATAALADIRRRNGPLTPVPHTPNDSAVRRLHEMLQKKANSE